MKKITIEEVLKKAKKLSKAEVSKIKKAYEFAKRAHRGQKRKTGDPYIIHPLYTAYYIADLGLGYEAICAALLHDTLEDTNVTEKMIKKEFNSTVLNLVKGVTKLKSEKERKITKSSVENLRKFFIVAAKDIRAVIIKLADRLHNAQTIYGLPKDKQKAYAREIKYVFSALADYLGLGFFKRQFDDISFKILNPNEYNNIEKYLKKHHRKRKHYVSKVVKKIKKLISKEKIKAEVLGREKCLYSINKKLKRYLREGKIHSKSEYGKIYDNYGFRVLVNEKEDCYRVLGIIHSTWHPIISEFEDYIANPKPNGYKSLHTTVFCDRGKIAEIQIRTHAMHEYNEFGPASHIAYNRQNKRYALPVFNLSWLRKINIFHKESPANKKNLYKVDVFKDNVFVLTPDNEVKKLPQGATPIDFAYAVHTEIGNKCRGAKVNGKLVQLDHELHTGDQVEILVDKNVKYPISGWLEFTVSPAARSSIKNALRKKEKTEAIQKGLKKLNEALAKYNTNFKKLWKEKENDLSILIYKNNAKDRNGLLANIGFDLIRTEKVISALFPRKSIRGKKTGKKMLVSIEGSTNTEHTIAKCCLPKPGDDIIGLTTINRGIRIHKRNCAYRDKFKEDRILTAKWVPAD